MKKPGIYKIENKINGKFYIGSSKNVHIRWIEHRKPSMRQKPFGIYRAFNKHGIENFDFSVICECTEAELEYYEDYYLKLLKPAYNMSKYSKGPNRGRKLSKEWKEKIGMAVRGKSTMPEEARQRMSLLRKGKKRKPEHIAAMRKPKTITPQATKARKENLKKAIEAAKIKNGNKCMRIDTGKVYNSTKEASLDVGVHSTCIQKACRGKHKTAKGIKWKYVYD